VNPGCGGTATARASIRPGLSFHPVAPCCARHNRHAGVVDGDIEDAGALFAVGGAISLR